MDGFLGEELADAAAPEHGLGDQRRLRPVVAARDEIFESIRLHVSHIDAAERFMSSG